MCERMVGPFEIAYPLIYEWEAWLVSRYCAVKGGQSPYAIFSTEILVTRLLAQGVPL
jgi:hypothetical protein